jgi:hypothetical protein
MRLLTFILGIMLTWNAFAQLSGKDLDDQNKSNSDYILSITQQHEKENLDDYEKMQKDLQKLALQKATEALNNA